jgi:hypothetical protein
MTLNKLQIIDKAVAAKKNREHRLARLLAHQAICAFPAMGEHTTKLLQKLIDEKP